MSSLPVLACVLSSKLSVQMKQSVFRESVAVNFGNHGIANSVRLSFLFLSLILNKSHQT